MPVNESPQHRTTKVSPKVFKQKILGWGLYCFKSDQNLAIHLGEIYNIQLKIIKKNTTPWAFQPLAVYNHLCTHSLTLRDFGFDRQQTALQNEGLASADRKTSVHSQQWITTGPSKHPCLGCPLLLPSRSLKHTIVCLRNLKRFQSRNFTCGVAAMRERTTAKHTGKLHVLNTRFFCIF